MTDTKTHGGQRPNAGRPRQGQTRRKNRPVMLEDSEQELLKEIGGGNVSAGVRIVLEYWQHN